MFYKAQPDLNLSQHSDLISSILLFTSFAPGKEASILFLIYARYGYLRAFAHAVHPAQNVLDALDMRMMSLDEDMSRAHSCPSNVHFSWILFLTAPFKVTLTLALYIPSFLVKLYLFIYTIQVICYLFILFIVCVLPLEVKLQESRDICMYVVYFCTISTQNSVCPIVEAQQIGVK